MENNKVEWYDLRRGKSMRPPNTNWLIKLNNDFNKLVEEENDIAAQVLRFEKSTKGRHFRGLYTKYSSMDKSQILVMRVAVSYLFKGEKGTMELLYNGDLTKVLSMLHRNI